GFAAPPRGGCALTQDCCGDSRVLDGCDSRAPRTGAGRLDVLTRGPALRRHLDDACATRVASKCNFGDTTGGNDGYHLEHHASPGGVDRDDRACRSGPSPGDSGRSATRLDRGRARRVPRRSALRRSRRGCGCSRGDHGGVRGGVAGTGEVSDEPAPEEPRWLAEVDLLALHARPAERYGGAAPADRPG